MNQKSINTYRENLEKYEGEYISPNVCGYKLRKASRSYSNSSWPVQEMRLIFVLEIERVLIKSFGTNICAVRISFNQ